MKLLLPAALILFLGADTLSAQRGGGRVSGAPPARTYGSPSGFGNILFPGVGTAPPLNQNWSSQASFAQRLGATVSGFPSYPGVTPPVPGVPRQPNLGFMPFPVFVGGGMPYAQPMAPNVTVVYPQQPPAPPMVIHQQTIVREEPRPGMREYTQDGRRPDSSGMRTYEAPAPRPAPEPEAAAVRPKAEVVEEQATIYLIALKGQTIYPAYAYWVQGDTLHYVTTQGSHNRATLDQIDRALTERLNRERGVEFDLGR